jgi:hypothetical protein
MRALSFVFVAFMLSVCQGTLSAGGDAGFCLNRCGDDDAGFRIRDAGGRSSEDAGARAVDAGARVIDAGARSIDAGARAVDSGAPREVDSGAPRLPDAGPIECVRAHRLWADGFETGDYQNWSGGGYGGGWGDSCDDNGLTTSDVHSGTYANRSVITCASQTDVHRGYGGVQFSGDSPMRNYTNSGVGIDAPYGLVNTFWTKLETPYTMGGGRWVSLFTTNSDCGWGERVITLGLEDSGMRLTPAHIRDTGGTVTFSPNAPSFPRGRWVRVTVYINYHRGEMHVWQDGVSVVHGTFTRPTNDVCQWHWGLYASGNNTDVVMVEDDKSIWKLEQAWTDFGTEPWFEGSTRPCTPP